MTEFLVVGGIVTLAAGYLLRSLFRRKKNAACARCALHEVIDKKR